jgi:alkanesulfonate monooxygenase SsuD/methylene tetrahydromethanopterin reductase-like flavin-dependent oxidoreductase (luciferase family)
MPTDELTSMPDPLAWLTFAAAHSRRIKVATGVLILPQYSPVQLAKRLATLDQLTRGRVMLGVGLGWQEEEYAALNIPFAERGRRMDENIRAMRALWTQSPGRCADHRGRQHERRGAPRGALGQRLLPLRDLPGRPGFADARTCGRGAGGRP